MCACVAVVVTALGAEHPIVVLLLEALNILCAATIEGASTMSQLMELTTKASFLVRRVPLCPPPPALTLPHPISIASSVV